MHLKSIEINGFKSFANKITFEFPHGITGIVGPNGSGKSNIGDAVRWVLGEQSAKQLRGSKMEDVIFSGTENRRPLGFAYVAIVFDNADRKIALDYDEVKVARRVYRSGESEYLINGSTCRRRDIVEIFYDTGIGKEGYSIIGQGQVEKILSGKIEDSRELFDEAAGIAKYKKNRAVTEKSLEQEHQNLERVTDILNELETRVGPLESQSKKAREYLRLKEKEKDLDLHLFLYDQQRLTQEKEDLTRQYEITEKDLIQTRQLTESIKEKNDQIRAEVEKLTGQTDEVNAARDEKSQWRDALDSERQELAHQMDSNLRLIAHYDELYEKDQAEEKAKKEALGTLESDDLTLKGAIAEKKDQLELADQELENLRVRKDHLTEETEGKRDRLFSLISSDADTKEKMSRYEAMEEQLNIRNAEYNSRLIAFSSERKGHQDKSRDLNEDYLKTKEEVQTLEARDQELSKKRAEAVSAEEEAGSRLARENQEYLRARSRYETLRNISERYDGYQNSIRQVMEQKAANPGILGVVADILTMDQRYETAIEIALGGALQNIVTKDNDTAKKMIGYLKKHRLGRATFLPLSNIRKRNIAISPYVLEEDGVIGVASSLVQTEKMYEDLVVSLLGRTVVVDTIDHALMLNRKNNFSLRLVTLDGELLNPGGAITGGAFRHSGNLLGRKREVEECRSRMTEKQTLIEALKKEQAACQQKREELDEKLAASNRELSQAKLRLHDLEQQLPEIARREEELTKSIRSLKAEHQILLKQLEEIRVQKEELLKEQESQEKLHEENHDVIDQLNAQLSDLDEEIHGKEEERNVLALDISQEEQKRIFGRSEMDRLRRELAALAADQKDNREKKAELSGQNEAIVEKIAGLDESIEALTKEIDSLSGQLTALRDQQKDLQLKQNKAFTELSDHNERLLVLEKNADRMGTRLEKIRETLETQINYMWDNYEITSNYARDLQRYTIKGSEVSDYRKQQKETGRLIRQLGSVNINAIEEYKEVGERYEFMKGQYDDIIKAEEHLQGMIRELNTEMRKLFTDQFGQIRTAFQKVFSNLFEGGLADLQLMDEENILECGIRIVAQPPGKKLQNILLLSGGERALTAIALLFAIQQLKPSPFCLLDEIEAALDDANIIRFSRYLKRLSKETQFIVITHRRGTMTAAEALYGITMQEKGVSTLISVDLIDKELEA